MEAAVHRKTLFIKDLQDGQQVGDLFLVSRKNYAETKAGKPYLALTLMDRSGEMEARVWDGAKQANEIIETGQVIMVQAAVKQFREQLQLNINSLRAVAAEEVLLEEFMPSSTRSSSAMQEELTQLLQTIKNPFLADLLNTIFQGSLLQQFLTAPAAKMMHHAYLGGLAEHTLSMARLADSMCGNYPQLDREILLAGCLLHDIGKIEEFDFSSVPFNYTDSGRLVGHLVLGSEMVRQNAQKIKGFPADLLNSLIHLILSHHGRHEFGAPCLPMTREAILLHHIDDIDAKMNLIDKLSAQVEAGTHQWSDYQRSLERFLLLKGMEQDGPADDKDDTIPSSSEKMKKAEKPLQDSSEQPRQKPLF